MQKTIRIIFQYIFWAALGFFCSVSVIKAHNLHLELKGANSEVVTLKSALNEPQVINTMKENVSMQTLLPIIHSDARKFGLNVQQLSVDSQGNTLAIACCSSYLQLIAFLDELLVHSVCLQKLSICRSNVGQDNVDSKIVLSKIVPNR